MIALKILFWYMLLIFFYLGFCRINDLFKAKDIKRVKLIMITAFMFDIPGLIFMFLLAFLIY